MNISLEINLGNCLRIYKIKHRSNGKTELQLFTQTEEDKEILCSLLFENNQAFEYFISLSFEEVEDDITEYVILLEDYDANIHYSKYYRSFYSSKEVLKDISNLKTLCLNVSKYERLDLKNLCYSRMKDEEIFFLPENLRSNKN
jgi:hypothetical protein